MKIHDRKINYKCSFFSFCSNFCHSFCDSESEQIPLTRSSSPYQVLSKTRKQASISFLCKIKEQNTKLVLDFPINTKENERIECFGLNPYEFYPKDQLFILEKYPYFLLSKLKETNLRVNFENTEEKLRVEINNDDFNSYSLTDIFINYLGFKMSEILNFDLNFAIYWHLTTEYQTSQLNSLQNFSDFIVKYDQTLQNQTIKKESKRLKTHNKTIENIKEVEIRSTNSLRSLEETKKFRRNSKIFEESDLIIGGLRINRGSKITSDTVLINFFQKADSMKINSLKEILIKSIYKALAYTKNLVILLHKTFPLELVPEIFDTSWSFFKKLQLFHKTCSIF